ncbi:hypothetical protein D1822_10725 [Phaeobacter inhibens]|nr:hypothetical protein D1822_10725 [Phaeobacter inhibens]
MSYLVGSECLAGQYVEKSLPDQRPNIIPLTAKYSPMASRDQHIFGQNLCVYRVCRPGRADDTMSAFQTFAAIWVAEIGSKVLFKT